MQKVTIMEVEGLFDVKIGCQGTYFLTAEALVADLKEYLRDPQAVEYKYFRYKNEMTRGEHLRDCGVEPAIPVDNESTATMPVMENTGTDGGLA